MIRYVTAEQLIAELQKHHPKLPIVLKLMSRTGETIYCRQLRYLSENPPFDPLSDLNVYEAEFANNMGQQGLGLFLDALE